MALTDLDTSALAKRYLPEAGSAWVARLCQPEPVAIPELASARARRVREGALTAQQRDGGVSRLTKKLPDRLFVADAQWSQGAGSVEAKTLPAQGLDNP